MNQYSGSDFDDFLKEEGIFEEVTARAQKRHLVLQLLDAMEQSQLNKSQLAVKLQTSRSQVDRLLDPTTLRSPWRRLGVLLVLWASNSGLN